jgi:deoxyadenosine/deoxycytidine kinase
MEPHFDVVDNPYLDDFTIKRWSFNLQIYFLNSRFRQVMQIRESGKKSYKTEPFYEDAHFCTQLVCDGLNDQS